MKSAKFLLAPLAAASVAFAADARGMKFCVFEPPYAYDSAKIGDSVQWELDALAKCTGDLDVIVLPEASDRQGAVPSPQFLTNCVERYNAKLLAACAETAKRCDAVVFVNAIGKTPQGWRNSTFAFNRDGTLAGRYDKAHLVASEHKKLRLDASYMWEWSEPYVLDIDGVRYAFMTCYDFYFYEAFSNVARMKPDVIIGCSHQRSDPHPVLESIGRYLAYNTGAYLVRSSVSMGAKSPVGGCSMVVAPSGEMLGNLYSRTGTLTVEFDPKAKYTKPMGYGNPEGLHSEYIEAGRRPWKYRPAGSAIVPGIADSPGRRICADGGHADAKPAGTLAALGAAVAVGAKEVSFDVDPGNAASLAFFKSVLAKLSCHAIMRVRLAGDGDAGLDEAVRLVRAYDAASHVYFASDSEATLAHLMAAAPGIARAARGGDAVAKALAAKCAIVEFDSVPGAGEVERAKKLGLRVNVVSGDAGAAFAAGADTVVVENFREVAP